MSSSRHGASPNTVTESPKVPTSSSGSTRSQFTVTAFRTRTVSSSSSRE